MNGLEEVAVKYGLEAIKHYNGWAMATLGISIVFSGLVVLSLVISQLHKVLALWESRGDYLNRLKSSVPEEKEQMDETPKGPAVTSMPLMESLRNFHMLSFRYGDEFILPDLLEMAEKRGLERPHSSLNALIQSEMIIPNGKGLFRWSRKAVEIIQKGGE